MGRQQRSGNWGGNQQAAAKLDLGGIKRPKERMFINPKYVDNAPFKIRKGDKAIVLAWKQPEEL